MAKYKIMSYKKKKSRSLITNFPSWKIKVIKEIKTQSHFIYSVIYTTRVHNCIKHHNYNTVKNFVTICLIMQRHNIKVFFFIKLHFVELIHTKNVILFNALHVSLGILNVFFWFHRCRKPFLHTPSLCHRWDISDKRLCHVSRYFLRKHTTLL